MDRRDRSEQVTSEEIEKVCEECGGPLDEYDKDFCSMACILNWDAEHQRLRRYEMYDSLVRESVTGSGSL